MKSIRINIILGLILLASCGPKPGIEPDWVSNQPRDELYWYGIGIVNQAESNPRQAARDRALDEIAMQIRVQVSGIPAFIWQPG